MIARSQPLEVHHLMFSCWDTKERIVKVRYLRYKSAGIKEERVISSTIYLHLWPGHFNPSRAPPPSVIWIFK